MTTHELKTWAGPFEAAWAGQKRHEVRRFDRRFEVGDMLRLREVEREPKPYEFVYTGRELFVRVTYITTPGTWGLPESIGVLSFVEEGRKRAKAEK